MSHTNVAGEETGKLSASDLSDLYYFWEMRRDLTRWCDWEQKKELVAKEYPELVFAWETRLASAEALSKIMEQIRQKIEEYEKE